ncbi:MAG: hypothetical protein Q6373_009030 [Candidatus Sigynarchaeota archaeon]
MRIRTKLFRNYILFWAFFLLVGNIIVIEWPRPSIGLPVNPSDLDYSGTSYLIWPFAVQGGGHPEGHPGIDFSWNFSGPVLAAVDAVVLSIMDNPSHASTKIVTTVPVGYPFILISYDEVITIPPSVVVGALVKRGAVVGHAHDVGTFYMFHFGIHRIDNMFSMVAESPELYFDDEALAIIGRSIWEPGTLMNKSTYLERNQYPFLTNPKNPDFVAMNESFGWIFGVLILGVLAAVLFISNSIANKRERRVAKKSPS